MAPTTLTDVQRADAAVKRAEEQVSAAERERARVALAAVDAGVKQTELAQALGVSRETLRQWLMVARAREGR